MPTRVYQWALYALLLAFVVGCGGTTNPDDQDGNGNGNDNDNDNDNDTSQPDDGGVPQPGGGGGSAVRFGSFAADGNFMAGTIASSQAILDAGESATLGVTLIDSNGNAITVPATVSFGSPCENSNLASIDPSSTTSNNGQAEAQYTATGCSGTDTVTATAAVGDVTLRASTTLETHAADVASILFESAVPPQLGLQGTGGNLPEQSTVTFKLTNALGQPAPDKTVNFSLSTSAGGITLSSATGVTGNDGLVSTTVSSGNVPTSVRVIAQTVTTAGNTITAVSNELAVTTGLPDNNSFTLSAETLNIEGWEYAGITTTLTAFLADRFNNPVPDGTVVTFTAEGGSVDSSCQTEGGQCTVTFRSQSPKPGDGRVTVLATATGEESFTDSNGSGCFDVGEAFVDLPEAFVDENEDGGRQTNEQFIDFNGDSAYSPASGDFTGAGCSSTSSNSIHVRDDLVIVLSGSSLNVGITPPSINLDSGARTVVVTVSDNGQVAPQGTTVSAEAAQGGLVGPTSYTQVNTNKPVTSSTSGTVGNFTFTLKPGSDPGTGSFLVTVTTPLGTITRASATIVQTTSP